MKWKNALRHEQNMKYFYVNFVSMWRGSPELLLLSKVWNWNWTHPNLMLSLLLLFLCAYRRRRRLGSVTELPLTYNFFYNLISSPTHKSLCLGFFTFRSFSSSFASFYKHFQSSEFLSHEVSCFLSISVIFYFFKFYVIFHRNDDVLNKFVNASLWLIWAKKSHGENTKEQRREEKGP